MVLIINFCHIIFYHELKLLIFEQNQLHWKTFTLNIALYVINYQCYIPYYPRLHTFPMSCNALNIDNWQHPNSIAYSWLVTRKDLENRSPSLNFASFANQIYQVCSVIASSEYNSLITRVIILFCPSQR